jgi:4-diphosphocytidyl-2C-methyl-D-erythritol kinase
MRVSGRSVDALTQEMARNTQATNDLEKRVISTEHTVKDQESRLRSIERKVYAIPGIGAILGGATLLVVIYQVIRGR